MAIGEGDVGSRRRWCTEIGDAALPTITAALSANPHGGRFRQADHAVQHHDGDGGLALLRLHGASAQPRSDQGLIAAYCGLGEAASPVAVVALPCHAATLGDVANTPVAHRTGLRLITSDHRRGARRDDDMGHLFVLRTDDRLVHRHSIIGAVGRDGREVA